MLLLVCLLHASMENKKVRRAPCKRACESETLDSVESTSGLVQQHAGGACNSSPKKPRLTNSETCTAVQLHCKK